MGIGQLIGKFWPLRAEQPQAECVTLAELSLDIERPASESMSTAREIADRQPVDEQAGDSFLGYVD